MLRGGATSASRHPDRPRRSRRRSASRRWSPNRAPRNCSRNEADMRLYRLLLFAFPAAVRREFGDDMAEMFAMQIDEAKRERRSVALLWIRAAADALANGITERASTASEPRARSGAGVPASARVGGFRGAKPTGQRWRRYMRAFVQDVKYALRMLARQPGVTFVAMLTLALGIGANTAIFSAVNAVLLRPLPYDDPDRVVTVWEKREAEGVVDNVVAPADYLDWVRMNGAFESMAAMTSTSVDLTGDGEPSR